MTTKPTLHPSPFALDIFITPPHPNSRVARDHKKNKVKPSKVTTPKENTKDKK
jgi:hypothetical protein